MRRFASAAACLWLASQAFAGSPADRDLSEASRLYGQVDYARALKRLDAAARHARGKADEVAISLLRGVILSQMGRSDEGLSAFRRALALDPKASLPVEVSPKLAATFERLKADAAGATESPPPSPPAEPLRPEPLPANRVVEETPPSPAPAPDPQAPPTVSEEPEEAEGEPDRTWVVGVWAMSDLLHKDLGVEPSAGIRWGALEATLHLRVGSYPAPGLLVAAAHTYGRARLFLGARADYYIGAKSEGLGPALGLRFGLPRGFGIVVETSGEYYFSHLITDHWGWVGSAGVDWRPAL